VQLRAQVEAAARLFEQSQRREDADAVVEAIKGVQASPDAADLLADFVRPVQQKLDVWRTQTASEAKLNKALASGASTQQLARAIQEASAAGVKVNKAKRTLKV
jgi:enoyl reductase-like protein